MDRTTRSAIERATQKARHLLEDEFEAQLEGTFDILPDGTVASQGGPHLTPRQAFEREVLVAAIERKRATGMKPAGAVGDYLRDAAFTLLNRFVALKMLEARGLVQQCVSRGPDSTGYDEFAGMAPGLPLLPDGQGYRLYLESLFDELSTEVKVLFDRRDPAGVLWPRRRAFDDLLDTLNSPDLSGVWSDDETIGWVYQYFNGAEERKKMRDESQAPRNSRELAVRNQFFTPRYVVQFLTDNTLGRTWVEMHGEGTGLLESCEYLVRPLDEPFGTRARKDPRDLKILDPACGSGHFLLYSFDLLLSIYEEAWAAEEAAPASGLTGRTLRADYPTLELLREATPALIVEHNLYGVDIDARCAQIAALALWLRAQRAYQDLGIRAEARPRIQRTHIVVAEPMPDDRELAAAFAGELDKPFQQALFSRMIEEMRLAGELGTLLQVELSIADDIRRARRQYLAEQERPSLFPDLRPKTEQGKLDLSGVTDETVFHDTEEAILGALGRFSESAGGADTRRRLFAGDSAQGVAFIDLVRTRFDVVLMNPPFGLPVDGAPGKWIRGRYPDASTEVSVAFCQRAGELLRPGGTIGAVAPRSWMLRRRLSKFRAQVLVPDLDAVLDLGAGVLDAAIDIAAFVVSPGSSRSSVVFVDRRQAIDRAALPLDEDLVSIPRSGLGTLAASRIVADQKLPAPLSDSRVWAPFQPRAGIAIGGLRTFMDARFVRLWWEVDLGDLGTSAMWRWWARTDGYSTFVGVPLTVLKWNGAGRELQAYNFQVNGQTAQSRQGSSHFGRPGIHFMWRSERLCPRLLPSGCAFSNVAPVILPNDVRDIALVLGWVASEHVRSTIEQQAHANAFTPGLVKEQPWSDFDPSQRAIIEGTVASIVSAKADLMGGIERYPTFSGLHPVLRLAASTGADLADAADQLHRRHQDLTSSILASAATLNAAVNEWAGTTAEAGLSAGDRIQDHAILPDRLPWRMQVLQYLMGVAFGRWRASTSAERHVQIEDLLQEPNPRANAKLDPQLAILHDDRGHSHDVVQALEAALSSLGGRDLDSTFPEGLRKVVAANLFEAHLADYSAVGRKAPIYWQLTTRSGRYSVWLYYPALSTDTLYRVIEEFASPRLRLEQRRLDDLLKEGTQDSRTRIREVDAQATLVEELTDMVTELRTVAAMWHPNLNDGVIVNHAPLMRLIPRSGPWQKQVLATWTQLVEGSLDWAHLAMHLWPERVVPKCATDRSLAIAHGLEDVFWAEGAAGKWTRRARPALSIDELVAQRTSPAVKAALATFLAAPVEAPGGRGRRTRE